MRVLQVFNRYRERGGEEKSVERIFQHVGSFCEVERLWWDSSDWDGESGPGALGQLCRLFHNKESARDLAQKIEEFQPHLLLCHNLYPVGSPSVYRTARRYGIPVVQYVHNFRPFSVGGSLWCGDRIAIESLRRNFWLEVKAAAWQNSKVKSGIFALLLIHLHRSRLLEVVTTWVCISDFMAEKFKEAGLPTNSVISLRHSWDPAGTDEPGEDGGYYLFLSRLVSEKGIEVLLEAWRLLELELGEKTPLLKIGGTGTEEEKVKLAARSQNIEFLGFLDGTRKETEIMNCRAMLAPSVWWEPLGLVTYEAYDYCKPMLAAASGGLTETVEDEVTGLRFEPDCAQDLKNSVLKLEKLSPSKRREMGLNGKAKLLADASPEKWKTRFESILCEAISKSQ